MFEIGDKVVCIKGGRAINGYTSERPLVEGRLYVVTHADPPNACTSEWGVRVAGNRTWNPRGFEVWWSEKRFRKLSDMQQEARERRNNRQPIKA